MQAHHLNALATATIAFVTVIGLMSGFYYNLRASGISMIYIVVGELLLTISIVLFTREIKRYLENEERK